jgi:hypothetical protein
MNYTPDEIAKLLANRPNQPHYVKALIGKCVRAALRDERERIEATGKSLYEITGGIKDINSVVIQRNAIRARSSQ